MTIYRGYDIKPNNNGAFSIWFGEKRVPGEFKFEEGAMNEIDKMKRSQQLK